MNVSTGKRGHSEHSVTQSKVVSDAPDLLCESGSTDKGASLTCPFHMNRGRWLGKEEKNERRTRLAYLLATQRPNSYLVHHFASFLRLSSRPYCRTFPRSPHKLPSIPALSIQAERKSITSGYKPRYWIRTHCSVSPAQARCSVSTQSHEISFAQSSYRMKKSTSLPGLVAR